MTNATNARVAREPLARSTGCPAASSPRTMRRRDPSSTRPPQYRRSVPVSGPRSVIRPKALKQSLSSFSPSSSQGFTPLHKSTCQLDVSRFVPETLPNASHKRCFRGAESGLTTALPLPQPDRRRRCWRRSCRCRCRSDGVQAGVPAGTRGCRT